MNLYLNNQNRRRDLDEYLNKLLVSPNEFNALNQQDNRLLLIGGGYSPHQSLFLQKTQMQIVNIDLAPPTENIEDRCVSIRADFSAKPLYFNYFNEIWALYSLPLYSPSVESIYLFIANAIIATKPGGIIRIFPIEFEKTNKMNTRDADYDITTEECSNTIINILHILKQYNITNKIVEYSRKDIDRKEYTILIYIQNNSNEKEELNNAMSEWGTIYSINNQGVELVFQ